MQCFQQEPTLQVSYGNRTHHQLSILPVQCISDADYQWRVLGLPVKPLSGERLVAGVICGVASTPLAFRPTLPPVS